MENKCLNSRLLESLLDVRVKNASGLTDEQFKNVISYDPTLMDIDVKNVEQMQSSREGNVRWLLKQYAKGMLTSENRDEVRDTLSKFMKIKHRPNVLPSADINYYKTFEDLKNEVGSAFDKVKTDIMNKDAHKNAKQLISKRRLGTYLNGAVELLFSGEDWEVWTPHTFVGSKALRRGATWCTGGDTDVHYNGYTQEGMLYVIINKNNKNIKYQLFVPYVGYDARKSKEFRDKDNISQDFRQFLHTYPELLDYFKDLEIITQSYPHIEDENETDGLSEDEIEQIIEEYNLGYEMGGGEITVTVPLYWMTAECKYITSDDLEKIIKYGVDGITPFTGYDIDEFYSVCCRSNAFYRDVSWEYTVLSDMHRECCDDIEIDVDFDVFFYTLFDTDGEEKSQEVLEWLQKQKGVGFHKELYKIVPTDAFDMGLWQEIVQELGRYGYNPATTYSDQFDVREFNYYDERQGGFIVPLRNVHTEDQFYRSYTRNGELNFNAMLHENFPDLRLHNLEYDYSLNTDDFDAESAAMAIWDWFKGI